jgi:hypothetical protein
VSRAVAGPSLDDFRLDDLRAILIDFYAERFNDNFDERSIGALVQELKALGLLARRGDSYEVTAAVPEAVDTAGSSLVSMK